MSILFVLLTFLLIITITYFIKGKDEVLQAAAGTQPVEPRMRLELGFDIPKDYSFHPGHTWAMDEGRQNARVGLDSFAANLLGKVDRVEVVGVNRWVRQGQKLLTLTAGDVAVDLLSPVEGVVTAVNTSALDNPSQVAKDPYNDGWICLVKAPDIAINQKNLVQGVMVAPWMQNSIARLNTMAAPLSAMTAQDGGVPMRGLLARLTPEVRQSVVREFFLT